MKDAENIFITNEKIECDVNIWNCEIPEALIRNGDTITLGFRNVKKTKWDFLMTFWSMDVAISYFIEHKTYIRNFTCKF